MGSVIIDSFKNALGATAQRIRAARETCAAFACRVRRMGKPFEGPFSFRWHPWTKEVHDSRARMIVAEKSSQMGFTETGINRALYDVVVRGRDVLYVLPDDSDAGTFSSGRVDAAIESSPFLSSVFTDVSNVGHKRAGIVNVYVRGSKSRSGLKSVPCGNLTLDELNEMDEKNVELVFQRVAGQPEDQVSIAMFSTPTVPDFGVSEFIKASSGCHWFFSCPFCNRQIELTWPAAFRIDRKSPAVICPLCKSDLEGEKKRAAIERGAWVPARPDQHERCAGYEGLSQLYSNTVSAKTLMEDYTKAQVKTSAEQEFFNGRLGVPHVAKGAKLTVEDVRACYGPRRSAHSAKDTTMGVDVGKWYHWVVSEWALIDPRRSEPLSWRKRVVAVGRCMESRELSRMIDVMGVRHCVIDAMPETREARRLQARHACVWMGWLRDIAGDLKPKAGARQIDLNRTEWLDVVYDRIRAGKRLLELPPDAGEEFEEHLIAPARVLVRGSKGDEVARYQSTGADHFAFAMAFDEVAHHLQFTGARPIEVKGKKEDEDGEKNRQKALRDPRRYADQVLERLTGFKRRDDES